MLLLLRLPPPLAPSPLPLLSFCFSERLMCKQFGASGGTDNNGRMMMLGWATPDFHGNAGPGINFLTRMTLLREVNYEPTLQNLVSLMSSPSPYALV